MAIIENEPRVEVVKSGLEEFSDKRPEFVLPETPRKGTWPRIVKFLRDYHIPVGRSQKQK